MNFDRVASIYDATRGLPLGVAERIVNGVIAATHADTNSQFLELGIGTGRIALPFVRHGFRYIGVDISRKMMQQLQLQIGDRYPNLELIESDVATIPIPDRSIDVVLNVHVLHLIPQWKAVIDEAQRVLRRDGYFVEGHDWSVPDNPAAEIRSQWRAFVEETGTSMRPSYGTSQALSAELTARRGRMATYGVARWENSFRPAELIEALRNRVFSATWDIPDDVLADVDGRMTVWATDRYGDLDTPVTNRWEFTVSVTRFAGK